MPENYQPKPISFVPPALKRKFIAPDNPREMGNLVILVSIAILIVTLWSGVADLVTSFGKQSAIGQRVAEAPFRSSSQARLVGVYLFEDEAKIQNAVRGERVFVDRTKIPKTARVVWPRGRPQKARVVFENLYQLFGIPIGIGVFGLGLWIRRKRVDLYAAAMNPTENAQDLETPR
jgi:hypothetical protein